MPLFIGVMSGTSVDGIDIALLDINVDQQPKFLSATSFTFEPDIQNLINDVILQQNADLSRLGDLHMALGEAYAAGVNHFLKQNKIAAEHISAIGCHGQTLFHAPYALRPFSFQMGDPNTIAALTGITTIADFRQRDLVCGGQGAPMVPPFHKALFQSNTENRVIVNIGGIGNITALPADPEKTVIGFDTGPGNILMDSWTQTHLGEPFDNDGQWAASGELQQDLLAVMLADSYFDLPIPKSTGREYFHPQWLTEKLARLDRSIANADVQTTLLHLTSQTISDAIHHYAPEAEAIYICGGGANNKQLMQLLSQLLSPAPVVSTAQIGLAADHVESSAFAWLAYRTLNRLSGNLPSVTGARQETVLGGVFWANSTPH